MKYLDYRLEKDRVIVRIKHWIKIKEYIGKFNLVYEQYPYSHVWKEYPNFKSIGFLTNRKLQTFLDSCVDRIMFENGIELV
jgi:hypothetical protein